MKYLPNLRPRLRHTFDNLDTVETNFGGLNQDLFVLMSLNGKKFGTYIEIGANHPVYGSNTFLLEDKFSWNGFSIEIVPEMVETFNEVRRNKCHCGNALLVDYQKLAGHFGETIDYLSVDVEPPENTLRALQKVLDANFKFRVITFEHDLYADKHFGKVRIASRNLLKDFGYELLVSDVAFNGKSAEDWYVHPDLVDKNIADILRCDGQTFVNYDDYMFS